MCAVLTRGRADKANRGISPGRSRRYGVSRDPEVDAFASNRGFPSALTSASVWSRTLSCLPRGKRECGRAGSPPVVLRAVTAVNGDTSSRARADHKIRHRAGSLTTTARGVAGVYKKMAQPCGARYRHVLVGRRPTPSGADSPRQPLTAAVSGHTIASSLARSRGHTCAADRSRRRPRRSFPRSHARTGSTTPQRRP